MVVLISLPSKSLLLKCALHLVHVCSPVEWFNRCLCRCSALVKLRPQLSFWQMNLLPSFFPLGTSFLLRPRVIDVAAVVEAIAEDQSAQCGPQLQ